MMTTIEEATASEALVGRLSAAALGTAELFTVHLGQVHGLYRAVDAGGMPAIAVAVGRAFPQLEAAFTTGAGVPYAEYGPEAVTAQAALNRPAYVNSLVAEWLPAMPDVQTRLAAGARVADVGTGAGWSAIGLAKAYPAV